MTLFIDLPLHYPLIQLLEEDGAIVDFDEDHLMMMDEFVSVEISDDAEAADDAVLEISDDAEAADHAVLMLTKDGGTYHFRYVPSHDFLCQIINIVLGGGRSRAERAPVVYTTVLPVPGTGAAPADPAPNCEANSATSQGVRVVHSYHPSTGGGSRPRCVVPERGPRSLP